MRARWVLVVLLGLALAMPLLPVAGDNGGVDPGLPQGLYPKTEGRPVITLPNVTLERGDVGTLSVTLRNGLVSAGGEDFWMQLEIYRWGLYGTERDLGDLPDPLPLFVYFDEDLNDTVEALTFLHRFDGLADGGEETATVEVSAPEGAELGYYRVRVQLWWDDGNAASMGHFSPFEWDLALANVSRGDDPGRFDFLLDEGGFTVVKPGYNYLRAPNRVPDLGDFTTPVIRPGEKGTYNFTIENRYEDTMSNVKVHVEIYMWATIEEAKAVDKVDEPLPYFEATGEQAWEDDDIGDVEPGERIDVRLVIRTDEDALKGTYFVRHRVTFTYLPSGESLGQGFVMSSRGFYSKEQWEGFDYTNLYYQLDRSAGIIPDSSFSVKDPVPAWPLATLIFLCALFGVLAVVFYLAEEHGDRYPRLKKALQYWSGKLEQRRRLLQQRLDELRGEVDVPLEDDEP